MGILDNLEAYIEHIEDKINTEDIEHIDQEEA